MRISKIIYYMSFIVFFSCGKKDVSTNPEANLGTISSIQESIEGNQLYKVGVSGNHSYSFTLSTNSNGQLIAGHNKMVVGDSLCLEYQNEICTLKELHFSFMDRDVLFTGKALVHTTPNFIPVYYYEKNNDQVILKYHYADARLKKIILNDQEVSYSFFILNYTNIIKNRDQVFIKQLKYSNDIINKLNIFAKLPRYSTKSQNIYTGSTRDNYRGQQDHWIKVEEQFSSDTIFSGVEAKDEWDHLFGKNNREVGLLVEDFKSYFKNN